MPKKSRKRPVTETSLKDWLKGQIHFGKADDSIILFVPSHDRDGKFLTNQAHWASNALDLMGELYGGATGFRDLIGVWRDDERGGDLIVDEPIMIQSLAKRSDVEDDSKTMQLANFCKKMGRETHQGAVAIAFNEAIHYMEHF